VLRYLPGPALCDFCACHIQTLARVRTFWPHLAAQSRPRPLLPIATRCFEPRPRLDSATTGILGRTIQRLIEILGPTTSVTPAQRSGISIRLRHRFSAPREKVFRAWTVAEVLKQWWCPEGWVPTDIQLDLRVGGTYRIGMRRAAGGVPVFVHGCFVEVCSPEKLVYTWKWENAFAEMPETRVTVHFLESNGTTEVILIHENLPEIRTCLRHWNGWISARDRIQRLIA
jgi:uncharacterized protein YndB with AHSA1/START domain